MLAVKQIFVGVSMLCCAGQMHAAARSAQSLFNEKVARTIITCEQLKAMAPHDKQYDRLIIEASIAASLNKENKPDLANAKLNEVHRGLEILTSRPQSSVVVIFQGFEYIRLPSGGIVRRA